MPHFDCIIVTDEGPDLLPRVARALSGSTPNRVAVQLRHKRAPASELFALARDLRTLTRQRGQSLLINDRVDVALAAEADGVHLPEASLPIETVRKLLGPRAWVGVSRHDMKGLFEAARDGADYATLAPVHAVPGKGPPLGMAGFARTIAPVRMPIYALGGIQPEHVPELRQAGARGVAVMRGVLGAHDPAQALSELLGLLECGA